MLPELTQAVQDTHGEATLTYFDKDLTTAFFCGCLRPTQRMDGAVIIEQCHVCWPGELSVIPVMKVGPLSLKTIHSMIKYLIFIGSRCEKVGLLWTGGRHRACQPSWNECCRSKPHFLGSRS